MPQQFEHKVCSFLYKSETEVSATVRSNVNTVADVKRWLSDFQTASNMTFRVERNRLTENSKENLYNVSGIVHD